MKDGSVAYLSGSKSYFVRREPDKDKWDTIKYYTLEREHIPLARAKCSECKEIIESKYCGDFRQCKCTKSFVDTDRWTPERHRYGGKATPNQKENFFNLNSLYQISGNKGLFWMTG